MTETERLQQEVEQLQQLLRDAAWEIQYLHERYGATISGEAVLERIRQSVPAEPDRRELP